ncbi:MAG: HEAT repeat domain-containing protein [Pirellulaceae bacterium]
MAATTEIRNRTATPASSITRRDPAEGIPRIARGTRAASRRAAGREHRQNAPDPKRTTRPLIAKSPVVTRRWLAVVLTTVVAMAAAWGGSFGWTLRSTSTLVTSLDNVPAEQIEPNLARLRVLGQPGRTALINALVHEREEVRQLARRQLLQEIDAWRALDDAESSRRVLQLAERLVGLLPETTSSSRRFFSNLATDLLLWPVDGEAIETPRLIQACETLLRAGFEGDLSGDDATLMAEAESRSRNAGSQESMPPIPAAIDPWVLSELAGGGLPIGPHEAAPLPPAAEPMPLDWAHTQAAPLPLPSAENSPPLGSGQLLSEAPVVESLDPDWLARATHFELFERLQVSDRIEYTTALEELKRRGFTTEMIELGQQLTDPAPAIRLQAVETLRRGVRFDPLAWLKMAAKDSDPQVRHAALNGLVETRDPTESRMARRRLQELEGGTRIR